MVEQK